MRRFLIMFTFIFLISAPVFADQGIISIKSTHSVEKTADRLENVLKSKGMTVVARIKHSEAAQKVGMALRPTELLIFGNPLVGTPLMQCAQSVALDLPQKALIWEDESGYVWISYNDPQYLAERHKIDGCEDVLLKIKTAMINFMNIAASP